MASYTPTIDPPDDVLPPSVLKHPLSPFKDVSTRVDVSAEEGAALIGLVEILEKPDTHIRTKIMVMEITRAIERSKRKKQMTFELKMFIFVVIAILVRVLFGGDYRINQV